MALSHVLLVVNSPYCLFQTQVGGKKKENYKHHWSIKEKKQDGRGIGINYAVAHNWEGEARPA